MIHGIIDVKCIDIRDGSGLAHEPAYRFNFVGSATHKIKLICGFMGWPTYISNGYFFPNQRLNARSLRRQRRRLIKVGRLSLSSQLPKSTSSVMKKVNRGEHKSNQEHCKARTVLVRF